MSKETPNFFNKDPNRVEPDPANDPRWKEISQAIESATHRESDRQILRNLTLPGSQGKERKHIINGMPK